MMKHDALPDREIWSSEDEGYIAVVPDLPECNAWGATEQEALKEVHDAIQAWIEACEKSGDSVPKPSGYLITHQPAA